MEAAKGCSRAARALNLTTFAKLSDKRSHHQGWILSIDTAMGACSAGVLNPASEASAGLTEIMQHGQAERLVPLIGEVLAKAGIGYQDLQCIVVTAGPGSFAGLRVGLATAKALALALDIPIYGVSTFQALAFRYVKTCAPAHDFAVVIDTRRDDFYIQTFDKNYQPSSAAVCKTGIEIEAMLSQLKTVLIGDGAERLGIKNSEIISDLKYSDVVITAQMFDPASNLFLIDPAPLYLRGADVSKSKSLFRKIGADL
jgi:tRNA threonylcarbamoyladenosine biosynthesis protein TsaB